MSENVYSCLKRPFETTVCDELVMGDSRPELAQPAYAIKRVRGKAVLWKIKIPRRFA
jgi:hypothetical protein